MLVNIEGVGAPGHAGQDARGQRNLMQDRPFAHMRGVHAVETRGCLAATISADMLVAWKIDRSMGLPLRELVRVPSPLQQSATSTGLRWLRSGNELIPLGQCADNRIPICDAERSLAIVEGLHMSGNVNDLVELADTNAADSDGVAPASRLVAANANRAFLFDRRAGPKPCARLPLQGICALASLAGAAPGAPPALLAAADKTVFVFDVRRLPEDTKHAKRPQELATLSRSGTQSAYDGLAVLGSLVVATDKNYGLDVWDVAAPAAAPAAVNG